MVISAALTLAQHSIINAVTGCAAHNEVDEGKDCVGLVLIEACAVEILECFRLFVELLVSCNICEFLDDLGDEETQPHC